MNPAFVVVVVLVVVDVDHVDVFVEMAVVADSGFVDRVSDV